jgi:hypothetical protein
MKGSKKPLPGSALMPKLRFAVDEDNRLVVRQVKFKTAAEGRFIVSEDNSLIYWLNEPLAWQRKYHLPPQIKFTGNWKLNDNYDLELNLLENPSQSALDKLVLRGEVFSTDRDTFAFEFRSRDKSGNKEFQVLKFSGSWVSDQSSGIVFLVDKDAQPDVLKLGAGWKLNKNQQITYTYEKSGFKSGVKDIRVITFEGAWEISPKNILTYVLAASSRSRFDFRACIQTPNVYPQSGKIKFRLGAGIKQTERSEGKVITLYGTWKFNRQLGLVFEMDYGANNIRALEFGADIDLTPRDKVVFSLVDRQREAIGVKITFTHRFLKKLDAQAYLKFKALRAGSGIEAGVKIPF